VTVYLTAPIPVTVYLTEVDLVAKLQLRDSSWKLQLPEVPDAAAARA
jgi:hypothetical protein